jgi:hypothetical protein
MVSSPHRWSLRTLLRNVLIAALILRLGVVLLRLAYVVPIKLDLSFPEGAIVARALAVSSGAPAYSDWREWPHQFAPYGPLTYYTIGLISRVLNSSSDPWFAYFSGRVQSVIALAVIASLLYFIARRLGLPLEWALGAPVAFVLWLRLIEYGASYRPDAVQVALALSALALAVTGRANLPRGIAAFALLWISFWFKAASFGVFAALTAWVAFSAGWRQAIAAGAVFSISGLLIGILVNSITGGLFFLNVIASLDNGWRPANIIDLYVNMPALPRFILVAGAFTAFIALTTRLAQRKRKFAGSDMGFSCDHAPRIVLIAAAGSWLFATIAYLKQASDINYFLEPYALTCLALVWGGRYLASQPVRYSRAVPAALLIIFISDAAIELRQLPRDLKTYRSMHALSPAAHAVEKYEGVVLATNPFFAFAADSPPTVMDHLQFAILVRRGKLDASELLRRVRERQFSTVIVTTDVLEKSEDDRGLAQLFAPEFKPLLMENYDLVESHGIHAILVPKGEHSP